MVNAKISCIVFTSREYQGFNSDAELRESLKAEN